MAPKKLDRSKLTNLDQTGEEFWDVVDAVDAAGGGNNFVFDENGKVLQYPSGYHLPGQGGTPPRGSN